MIGIEVNGKFLVIDKSSSIRIEKNYPILFQGFYQGDFTFPFSVDAENNYEILGFANIPSASNKITTFNCMIFLFGLPYQSAILRITKTTRQKFQVNLVSGLKTLKNADKLLSDLDLGEPVYLGQFPPEIAAKATVISKDFDYTHFGFTFIPHTNKSFYSDTNPTFNGVINAVDPTNGNIHFNTSSTGNKYAILPWFFLHYILKKIFEAEGLVIKGSFWDDPEMKSLLMYNNFALDSLNEIGDTKIITTAHSDVYQSDFHFSGSGLVGTGFARTKSLLIKGPAGTYDEPMAFDNANSYYTITEQGIYNFEFSGHVYILADLPYLKFGVIVNAGFVVGIPLSDGSTPGPHHYNFSGSFTATLAHVGSIITLGFYYPYGMPSPVTTFKWGYLTQGSTLTITQSSNNNLNLFSRYVYPNKHVPKITVQDFLLAVKQLGVEINFNQTENAVYLDFITDKINAHNTVDWTDKATADFETNLDNYNKGYLLSYQFDENDKLTSDNFKPVDLSNNLGDFVTFDDLPVITSPGKTAFVKNLNQYFVNVFDQYASPQFFWRKYSDFYYDIKYANGEEVTKLKYAPMIMGIGKNIAPTPNITLETALMPFFDAPGSTELYSSGSNDFSLQFCFLRGQNIVGGAPYNKGGNYIYAGTTRFGLNGHIVGNFDFTLHTDNGFFKRFIDFVYELSANGEETETDFRLTELDILKLSEFLKISVDGVSYLLKTISVIAQDSLKPCRAKMIKF